MPCDAGDVAAPCYTKSVDRASGPCLFYSTHWANDAPDAMDPDAVDPDASHMWACIGPFAGFSQEPREGIPYRDVAGRNLSIVMARVVNPGDREPIWAACSQVTTYLSFRKGMPRTILKWEEQWAPARRRRLNARACAVKGACVQECRLGSGPSLAVSGEQDAATVPFTREMYRTSGPCLFYTTHFEADAGSRFPSSMWTTLGPFSNFTKEPETGIPYSLVLGSRLSIVLARASSPSDREAPWVPCSPVTTYVNFTKTDRRVLHWEEQTGPLPRP